MSNKKNFNQADIFTFVSDLPIGTHENDLLNMEPFCDGLINFIREGGNGPSNGPIVITLEGELGSGKTSFMNIIKSKLCDDKDAPFYSVNINTWQFSLLNENSHKSSSYAIIKILQSMINQIMELKPNTERKERIDKIINNIAITASGIKPFYDVIGDPLLTQIGVNKATIGFVGKIIDLIKVSAKSDKCDKSDQSDGDDKIALVEQLHSEIQLLVNDILNIESFQVNQDKQAQRVQNNHDDEMIDYNLQTKPYAPLEIQDFGSKFDRIIIVLYSVLYRLICTTLLLFANCIELILNHIFKLIWEFMCHIIEALRSLIVYSIKEILSIFNNKVGNQSKVNNQSVNIINNNNCKQGFIFFIDDLDRINPDMALKILEVLRNILNIEHCIFILAVDPTVLNIALDNKFGKVTMSNQNFRKQYLDKFIQLSLPMPIPSYDVVSLLKNPLIRVSFFTKHELESNELIKLIGDVVEWSIGKNPRSIKKFFNHISLNNTIRKSTNYYCKKSDSPNPNNAEQISLFDRETAFVSMCIWHAYNKIFNILYKYPYFKGWNDSIADELNVKPLNHEEAKHLIEKLKASTYVYLEDDDIESYKEWEIVLFRICNFDDNLKINYFNILCLLRTMDRLFEKDCQNADLYKKSIVNLFKKVYRINPFDDVPLN